MKTRGNKTTGTSTADDRAVGPMLSSSRIIRTPPQGTPGRSTGQDPDLDVMDSQTASKNVQTPGSSSAYDIEQMSATIRELQAEVKQLKGRIDTQVGNDELYERVTGHKEEMRNWRRRIEERLEREQKANEDRIAAIRREVQNELEHLRLQSNTRRGNGHEEQAGPSFRMSNPRNDLREPVELDTTRRLQNETLGSRWIPEESTRFDATLAAAARPFKVKPQMPTYEGRPTERPPKYLREMKRFVEATRLPEEELKFLITQSLRGNAGEWWDIVSDQITTWAQFSRALQERFWSSAIQRKVRDNLNAGVYRPEAGSSRVAYAMKLIGTARDLLPRPTDEEIVQTLARHFTQSVDDCVLGQNICTIDAFLALLERFDNGGTVNRQRQEERPNYTREWNSRVTQDRIGQPTANTQRPPTANIQRSPTANGMPTRPNKEYNRPMAEQQRPNTEYQRPKYENTRPWQDSRRPQERFRDGGPDRIRLVHLEEEAPEDEHVSEESEAIAENE